MEKTGIIVMGAAGRMGGLIARLVAESDSLRLAGMVDRKESLASMPGFGCPESDNLAEILDREKNCVVIDFTAPEVSLASARTAAAKGAALVIGTTGFTEEQKEELRKLAAKTPILWSANMSIGVNVLMRVLPELAKALGPAYDMEMLEIHHRDKKDAPSGTALMLAGGLANARGWDLKDCRNSQRDGITGPRPGKEIGVMALRGGDVVGIHTAYFMGPGEVIEVKHQAESRENFAQGALRAAQWLVDKKPGELYSMQDVIA